MELKGFFEKHPKIALGFSGGVDSSYLLYAAKKYGADVKPYFIKTQFQPQFELDDAFEVAAQIGTDFEIIEYDSLGSEAVAVNDKNRCYYCKKNIFGIIAENAFKDGYDTVIDGTNASDIESERPGMRALGEMRVLSPLRMCDITKDDVRKLSRAAGLVTWDKPSYSCLATRVGKGERLNTETLKKIEAVEKALMNLGFSDFRLRVSGGEAKLQVKSEQMQLVIDMKEEIKSTARELFNGIALDLEGR